MEERGSWGRLEGGVERRRRWRKGIKKKKKHHASLAPNTMHIFKRAKVKRYNFTQ